MTHFKYVFYLVLIYLTTMGVSFAQETFTAEQQWINPNFIRDFTGHYAVKGSRGKNRNCPLAAGAEFSFEHEKIDKTGSLPAHHLFRLYIPSSEQTIDYPVVSQKPYQDASGNKILKYNIEWRTNTLTEFKEFWDAQSKRFVRETTKFRIQSNRDMKVTRSVHYSNLEDISSDNGRVWTGAPRHLYRNENGSCDSYSEDPSEFHCVAQKLDTLYAPSE